MAVYKVPQDVEAEDKLLGPFSFRQFIYLVVAVLGGGLAYFLGTIFIGLVIIPLPISIIFLVLALPLKKDQPMEVYAAAILSFYLKPRRKLWEPDGILTMVEFTNDGPIDKEYSPDITFNEARQRISYLSNLVDSNGEIIRTQGTANPSLQADVSAESTQVEDIHDEDAMINQKFDAMINHHNQVRREQILENLSNGYTGTENNQQSAPQPMPDFIPQDQAPQFTPQFAPQPQFIPPQPMAQPTFQPDYQPQSAPQPIPDFNAYQPQPTPNPIMPPEFYPPTTPVNMPPEQFQIPQPSYQPAPQDQAPQFTPQFAPQQQFTPPQPGLQSIPPESTQTPSNDYHFNPSPDIINLANNNDLSVQTLAAEAKKITNRNKKLLGEEEEVVISLR